MDTGICAARTEIALQKTIDNLSRWCKANRLECGAPSFQGVITQGDLRRLRMAEFLREVSGHVAGVASAAPASPAPAPAPAPVADIPEAEYQTETHDALEPPRRGPGRPRKAYRR